MTPLNFRSAIKGNNPHLMTVCGCTKRQLRLHIEAQFKPGMYWWNYGFEWEIDHITPTSFFADDTEGRKACHHFSNLQPLWISENIRKGNKMGDKKLRSCDHPAVVNREKIRRDYYARMKEKWGEGCIRLKMMTVFECGEWVMEKQPAL